MDSLSRSPTEGLISVSADAEGSFSTTAAGAHKRGRISLVMKPGRYDLDFPRPLLPPRLSLLLLLLPLLMMLLPLPELLLLFLFTC